MNHVFTLFAFALMSSASAQVSNHVSEDGLRYWSDFDGSVVDQSIHQTSTSLFGAVPTVDRNGMEEGAMFFDGVDDHVKLFEDEEGVTFEGELTVAAWMKAEEFLGGQHPRLFHSSEGVGGGFDRWFFTWSPASAGSVVGFGVGNGQNSTVVVDSQNSVTPGDWHHVAAIFHSGLVKVLVDGVLESEAPLTFTSLNHINAPVFLGSALGNSHFNGALDEVGIWDRALSTEEIQTLYYGFPPILGCTDMLAGNFNPDATIDNGTCQYCTVAAPEIVSSCGETAVLSAPELASNVSWSTGEEGQQIEVSESGFYSSEWTLELSGVDSALGFVEPNAWMSIPSLALPQEYTLQVWTHFPLPETSDGHNTIFSDSNTGGAADLVHLFFHESCGLGVGDQYQSGNCVAGGVYGTGVLASDVSEGWHLITASSTPAGTTFFIDDVEVGTVNHQVSGPIVAVGNNAGGNGVGPQQAGVLSQARVWGGAMTSEHVVEAFHCNTANIELELLAHWALDNSIEGGIDLSGGGYSGTLQNVSSPVETTYCFSCETKEWAVDFPEPNCGAGTVWDAVNEECVVANPSDSNFDGCVQLNDLLDLLSAYGDCGVEESPWQCGDPLEYQGYSYETVQIGEQCWFAENLRSENYLNGDEIPAGLSDSDWFSTTSGATAVYEESSSNLEMYGRLYNWFAVDDVRGLCPNGWHVPSDEEWMTMEMTLGMSEAVVHETGFRGTNQGSQLKTDFGWDNDGNGTNTSGFSGLAGGYRFNNGGFAYKGSQELWWSSSPDGSYAWHRFLEKGYDNVSRNTYHLGSGFAIRCIQSSE